MAKKKKNSGPKQTEDLDSMLGALLKDPSALLGMAQMLGIAPPEDRLADTPLDRAQNIVFDAYEAPPSKQVGLAKKALAISPDCADAYLLLADHGKTFDEAMALCQQALAAGERALGKQAFEEWAGSFWGVLETRPYMRARERLAMCLAECGRREEAVEHYEAMLRLNPQDNQGIRCCLVTLLLDLKRDADTARLLDEYKLDKSPDMAFSRVLLAFRQNGDSAAARKQLKVAVKFNRHVPQYLVGNQPLPEQLPEYVSPGGDDEAVAYVCNNRRVWLETPGAISWLRSALDLPVPQAPRRRRPSWSQLRAALQRCPQESESIWQVDLVARPAKGASEPAAPLVVIVDQSDGYVIELESADSAEPADVWEVVVDAIRDPRRGDSFRPAAIEVRDPAFAKAWQAKLKQVGIACRRVAELTSIDAIRDKLPTLPTAPLAPAELSALPVERDEVWQAAVRPLPNWVTGEGQPYRPWLGLVVSNVDDLIVGHEMSQQEPGEGWLADALVNAMRRPLMGQPHRPGRIEVATPALCAALQARPEFAGVDCVARLQLAVIDQVLNDMAEHMGSQRGQPCLLDAPGIELAQLASFYAAAAEYYRRRPWRDVAGDRVISVHCDKFKSGPWYAVVMGQSGVETGLATYEDLQTVQRVIAGGPPNQEAMRKLDALSLTYVEAFDIPTRELDTAAQHAWPVASPEAHPLVMRVNPGMVLRTPLAWELEFLEGCLRAIPDFLKAGVESQSQQVTLATGHLTLWLAWVNEH